MMSLISDMEDLPTQPTGMNSEEFIDRIYYQKTDK
jgi:hypothetical protein